MEPTSAMEQVGIIDLGSNACRLAVFAYEPGRRFMQVDELRQRIRLASGTSTGAVIRGESLNRGVEILKAFRDYCDASHIRLVRAAATSAVRDAQNGDMFLAAAKAKAGVELEILPGEVEAASGVLAIANSYAFPNATVLDVGGGSAQLSRMENRRFVEGQSWPIGTVRMSEAFLTSDPPKKKEVKALEEHVERLVGRGFRAAAEGKPLVGMGGTIRNLARVDQVRRKYPTALLHGYVLEASSLSAIAEQLAEKSVSERKEIAGLSAERADVVAAGAIVVREIMRLVGASSLHVSGQGLREGLFYRHFLPGTDPPLLEDVRDFSVRNMVRRFYDHGAHNDHVVKLSLELFDQLEALHGFGRFERDLLTYAAMLHDVGMAVEYHEHHSHGVYLVMSGALPGFSHREQAMIAILVGGHRKGKPGHFGLDALLQHGDHGRIEKLAGILRLAEYLERPKAQRVKHVRCLLDGRYLQIQAIPNGEAGVEVEAANAKRDLLEKAFGLEVEVVLGMDTGAEVPAQS